jgi:hypothetical protein
MAERKRFSGDREAAFDYLGIGRNLLDQMLLAMRLNNLQVLSRSVGLPNGVTITVSSMFGHHDIHIDVPASVPQQERDALQDLTDSVQHYKGFATLADTITLKSSVRLTVTTREPSSAPSSAHVPSPTWSTSTTPTGGASVDVDGTMHDFVTVGSSVAVSISVHTTIPGGLKPTGPSVIIGGGTQGGDAFVWDDYNGYTQMDNGGNWALQRRNAVVIGMSPDGHVLCGSLEQYDSNPNTALTNPFTGVTPAIGWVTRAAKWASRTDQPQLPSYTSGGTYPSKAITVTSDGNTVKGTLNTGGGFSWNGKANTNWSNATAPSRMGLTSPDGKVVVSLNGSYTISGQTKQWRGNVGLARAAPNDAVPFCVVHVTPAMAEQPPQDVVTTQTFVFSG